MPNPGQLAIRATAAKSAHIPHLTSFGELVYAFMGFGRVSRRSLSLRERPAAPRGRIGHRCDRQRQSAPTCPAVWCIRPTRKRRASDARAASCCLRRSVAQFPTTVIGERAVMMKGSPVARPHRLPADDSAPADGATWTIRWPMASHHRLSVAPRRAGSSKNQRTGGSSGSAACQRTGYAESSIPQPTDHKSTDQLMLSPSHTLYTP